MDTHLLVQQIYTKHLQSKATRKLSFPLSTETTIDPSKSTRLNPLIIWYFYPTHCVDHMLALYTEWKNCPPLKNEIGFTIIVGQTIHWGEIRQKGIDNNILEKERKRPPPKRSAVGFLNWTDK